MSTPANPALKVGTGRGNAVVNPQPGMAIAPVVLADAKGNVSTITPTGSLASYNGSTIAGTTLNAVTTNTVGTTVDAGVAQSNWTAVANVTGTPTAGILTLELSLDNSTWVSSTATAAPNAAGSYLIVSSLKPARYARVSLTSSQGTFSMTVTMMAAG